MNVEFAARLRSERERLALTQAKMAEKCGVAKRTYTYYEAGDRSPDADFLARAAKAGVDIAYVIGVDARGKMPDPQLPAASVEAAIQAVQRAQIARLAFVDPDRIWPVLQRTAIFGEATVGGYDAKARAERAAGADA